MIEILYLKFREKVLKTGNYVVLFHRLSVLNLNKQESGGSEADEEIDNGKEYCRIR